MIKLKKNSLSRGSFRTHGRVIGNKNFFLFLALCDISAVFFLLFISMSVSILYSTIC